MSIGTRSRAKSAASKNGYAPDPRAIRHTAELLKHVSDPTRILVLMMLARAEHNVTEICEALGAQSQPAVSHHLALLRHGRLIEPRRDGKHNYYGLTDQGRALVKIVDSLVD